MLLQKSIQPLSRVNAFFDHSHQSNLFLASVHAIVHAHPQTISRPPMSGSRHNNTSVFPKNTFFWQLKNTIFALKSPQVCVCDTRIDWRKGNLWDEGILLTIRDTVSNVGWNLNHRASRTQVRLNRLWNKVVISRLLEKERGFLRGWAPCVAPYLHLSRRSLTCAVFPG